MTAALHRWTYDPTLNLHRHCSLTILIGKPVLFLLHFIKIRRISTQNTSCYWLRKLFWLFYRNGISESLSKAFWYCSDRISIALIFGRFGYQSIQPTAENKIVAFNPFHLPQQWTSHILKSYWFPPFQFHQNISSGEFDQFSQSTPGNSCTLPLTPWEPIGFSRTLPPGRILTILAFHAREILQISANAMRIPLILAKFVRRILSNSRFCNYAFLHFLTSDLHNHTMLRLHLVNPITSS